MLSDNMLSIKVCARFACEGLKRLPSDQSEKIYQLIKVPVLITNVENLCRQKCNLVISQVINRKFLRSKMVPILEETRKSIQEKAS